MVEAEIFLELPVRLLARPARLDRADQRAARRAGRQVGEANLALARRAPLADQPSRGARPVAVVAPRRAVADPHAGEDEAGRQPAPGTLTPRHAAPGRG